MARRLIILGVMFIFAVSLTGCATSGKQKDLENQKLRNQISLLDVQIQNKDAEINNLRESLVKTSTEKETLEKELTKRKSSAEVKSRPTVKQMQIALLNAGYNPGPVDGRMGKQTKDAVKAFQKANNLTADGKVGKQTWALLRPHLDKKIK